MSEVTLTNEQWRLLWRIAFGLQVLGVKYQLHDGGQIIWWRTKDQKDMSDLVNTLNEKGVVQIIQTKAGYLSLKITKLGHEAL